MKQGSTLFLKTIVCLLALPAIAVCLIIFIKIANHPVRSDYVFLIYPAVAILSISVVPYFIALQQSFRLLCFIDQKLAFSFKSVNILKNIKFSAFTISLLYVFILPFSYLIADKDDSPGLILFNFIPILASMVIAVFAAVLQKLLKEAIDIKTENDLTV